MTLLLHTQSAHRLSLRGEEEGAAASDIARAVRIRPSHCTGLMGALSDYSLPATLSLHTHFGTLALCVLHLQAGKRGAKGITIGGGKKLKRSGGGGGGSVIQGGGGSSVIGGSASMIGGSASIVGGRSVIRG